MGQRASKAEPRAGCGQQDDIGTGGEEADEDKGKKRVHLAD